ncbi:MAG: hypothetical protein JWL61_1014 [Gemmatimonadetes bacterium]|jgi:hypothetical protein|nr:hypothetical protein [Gemmatimonadota bacterium]
MTPRFIAIASMAMLALSASPAQSQIAIMVAGGVNAPVGTLGDLADLGYNIAAGVNVGATLLPIGLRFEGAYNGFQVKNFAGGGDVRVLSGTANAIFNIGRTKDAPYLIAGLGGYNRQLTLPPFGRSSNETVVGINGGGGLRFPLVGLTTFVEARYHVMLGDKSDATDYQFIPITFGIVF